MSVDFNSDRGDILIVDDTPANLKLLSNILSQDGYRVRAARSGEMALDSVESAPPELILLDIKMPEMDGYEVCATLKANKDTANIPVIFISALNDIEDIIKAFDLGGVDYIMKPFKFREVLARVDSQLTLARQRRHIEEQRERDRQYYEALTRMKTQFVDGATHDLKNPLQLIMGFTSLLEEELTELGEEYTYLVEFVDGLKFAHKKMLSLVTDMLDLAQVGTGLSLKREPVDLVELLHNYFVATQMLSHGKKLEFVFTPPERDVALHLDSHYFGRALENLLSNAVKYTPEGGRIELAATLEEEMVVIRVIDNGPGIPEAAMTHLFDTFYRVQQEAHRDIEGTGLGLSIVKSIVEQHGGRVGVESKVGEGSMFSITLPLPQAY